MKTILIALVTLFLNTQTFAGGSASKSDIMNLVDFNLAWHLSQSFYMEDTGSCLRAGNHLPNGGQRLLPCEIKAWSLTGNQAYLITLDNDGESYSAQKL